MIVVVVVALFFINRKGRSRQNAALEFRANLAPGQEIMTASGLFGTIVAVDEDVITLETSPGVTSRWVRRAILERVTPPVADEDDSADGADSAVATGTTGPSLVKGDVDLQVPDDASSLTSDPDEGDTPRR
ncbi:MAG TPA: preprotein translocase subunit YajC [Actinotalea sp.]